MGAVDDASWIVTFHDIVATAESSTQHKYCVYRIPDSIRKLRPLSYTFIVLPLGPYNVKLTLGDSVVELKREVTGVLFKSAFPASSSTASIESAWNKFCVEVAMLPEDKQVRSGGTTSPLLSLCSLVENTLVPAPSTRDQTRAELKNFYEDMSIDSTLQAAVVMDAVFITGVFTRLFSGGPAPAAGSQFDKLLRIFSRGSIHYKFSSAMGDIFSVLENQIPLYMIENVWKKVQQGHGLLRNDVPFTKLLKENVVKALERSGLPHSHPDTVSGLESCDHLLACLYKMVCDPDDSPAATVSADKGYKATLYLPTITFTDLTEKSLLNLCAYEWMNVDIKMKKLFAYVTIMDELIDSEEDVQLLRKGTVIDGNYLGQDKAIVDLFSNPLQNFNATFSDFSHLQEVMDQIERWCRAQWRVKLTRFIDRFKVEPWLVITLVVSTFLLVASILQSIAAVKDIRQW
ncbi:hypothetical protein R1flu_023294 [Riccia fluitans]|uniref:Uncharacterized protein n=1 Tax=Riccia fluitans TaxID=41844 RepID=A0ABD1XRM0_9MARC